MIKKTLVAVALMIGLVGANSTTLAAKPPVMGWLEGVHFQGIEPRLRAKLDSGALTSSIHGENKRFFTRDGERWLRFDFHWHKKNTDTWLGPVTLEAPLVRKVKIKEHDDDPQKRPVVELKFSLNGQCEIAEFSVVNRSGFNYPVLMGRRFLAGAAIIDPRKTFTKATEKRGKSACPELPLPQSKEKQTRVEIKKPLSSETAAETQPLTEATKQGDKSEK